LNFIVPINDGLLEVDYEFLEQGIQISETECYVKMRPGFAVRPSWQEITEAEFEAVKPPIPDSSQPSSTNEEKLARLEKQNLILMDALATTFEEVLTLRATVEGRAGE